ncbi:MAG: hypothetical protein NVS2B9_02900 [Myxococcales bacterium]
MIPAFLAAALLAQAAAPATSVAVPAAASSTASASTTAAAAPESVIWTGAAGLGLIALTGNSRALTVAATLNLQRKSPDWIAAVRAGGAYGQTTPPGADVSQVNALNALLEARGDRRLTERLSIYLLAGVDTDHLKSIEERPYGELGTSYLWLDEKEGDLQRSSFKTDLGFRYGREFRRQYYPTPAALASVDIVAPRVGAAFRYALSREVVFTDEAGLLLNLANTTRALFSNTAKLTSRLTERVGLGVAFVLNDDSVPPPGKVSVDTAVTVGLEVGL